MWGVLLEPLALVTLGELSGGLITWMPDGGPEERWETSSWGVEGAGRSLQVARVGVPGGVVCLGYGGPGTGPGLGRTGRHHCVGCCLP